VALAPGIYPAAVTPFDEKGRIDMPSVARMLAWFEAAGCRGAVLAGTNGEGPSLSAVEKRDLIKGAMPLRGKLELVLGIASTSSDEAVWLCKQAHVAEAAAVLLMAPFYFREASEDAICQWFELVMSRSPLPVIVYNFPQRTGITITPEMMRRLAIHENFAGAKDSSGSESNICGYKEAVPEGVLFVGNETLLLKALQAGWTGSISGAANAMPHWLSQIVLEWTTDDKESAEVKFELILPLIEALRKSPQPALNKALLAKHRVLSSPEPRLPLTGASDADRDEVAELIRKVTGFRF
jgi:4-hydroxy-tetrahydrodipicolinate synthase